MWVTWLSLGLSLVLMWISMICTAHFGITTDPPLNPYWVFYVTLSSPLYWFTLILSTVVALLPRCVKDLRWPDQWYNGQRQMTNGS